MSKLFLAAGLYRVQESVFLGELHQNRRDELYVECRDVLDVDSDRLFVVPMCREDFDKMLCVGERLERDLIAGELPHMLF